MKRIAGIALFGLACRTTTPVDRPQPNLVPPAAAHVESIPAVFADVSSTPSAACAQHDGVYRCWGAHAAFAVMLGRVERSTLLERAAAIEGHGALRRLVLTAHDAWALTEGGEVIAWTDRGTGLDEGSHQMWKPQLGADIRDIAVDAELLCVRRGADVVCWSWRFDAQPDEKMFARRPEIMRTPSGAPAPAGRLMLVRSGIAIETASGCMRIDALRDRDGGESRELLPEDRCGAMSMATLEDRSLPLGVDARERGACLLLEGVRLLCPMEMDAREGTQWERLPRLVARTGGASQRTSASCHADGALVVCGDDEHALPTGTVHAVAHARSRDFAEVSWIVGSDGSVYVMRSEPELVGRGAAPVQIGAVHEASCIVDARGALKCARLGGRFAAVKGIRNAKTIVAMNHSWLVVDAKRELWRIDAFTEARPAPQPRSVGNGEIVVALGDRVVVRDASGSMMAHFDDGPPRRLTADDPVVRFLNSEAWIELVHDTAMLCGRTAAGVVGCTFIDGAPWYAPIGLEQDPTFARPPLPFAATELFEDDAMCAASSTGEVACWGRRYGESGRYDDVTDRVMGAEARDAR